VSVADVLDAFVRALSFAFGKTWEITCAQILGFALSATVQAVISKAEMSRLPRWSVDRDRPGRYRAVATRAIELVAQE
jgi:hypothetical protein